MENIGNSCYFNSVIQVRVELRFRCPTPAHIVTLPCVATPVPPMQCLFSLPEFKTRYLDRAEQVFRNAPARPGEDINTQLSKLAVALLTDKYGTTLCGGT